MEAERHLNFRSPVPDWNQALVAPLQYDHETQPVVEVALRPNAAGEIPERISLLVNEPKPTSERLVTVFWPSDKSADVVWSSVAEFFQHIVDPLTEVIFWATSDDGYVEGLVNMPTGGTKLLSFVQKRIGAPTRWTLRWNDLEFAGHPDLKEFGNNCGDFKGLAFSWNINQDSNSRVDLLRELSRCLSLTVVPTLARSSAELAAVLNASYETVCVQR